MTVLILKNTVEEGAGSFGRYLSENDIPHRILELAQGDEFPSDLSGIRAVASFGGPMNVYEEGKYKYLKNEDIFIKQLLERNIPFLGVCLGAQLLAKACGAKVYSAGLKEIGWYRTKLTQDGAADQIFKGLQKNELDVFQWHGDTFDLPIGATLLSNGDPVHNQAFRVGKNAYAFQFHIEAEAEKIAEWFSGDTDSAKYLDKLSEIRAEYDATADMIYANFLNLR